MRFSTRAVSAVLACTFAHGLTRSYAEASADQHDDRQAAFREAKFGMFIHWGLYAIPARGEWVMAHERIPAPEYAELAWRFNPVQFNAEEWVRIAKEAGMRYIVITAKHHDGFAMYGSKASPFNIVDATPFTRDPLKELAEACAREGIALGFYYSHHKDWHHPGGGTWDPSNRGDFNQYMDEIALPQVRELLTGYGPVFLIWFDMPTPSANVRAGEFSGLVRSLQPDALINSRLMHGGAAVNLLTREEFAELKEVGVDYLSYADRQIPTGSSWPAWETCMTLNESWGYTERDQHWKSPEELIEQLVNVSSRGGNFLLNVGPTAEGLIPEPSVRNLNVVGEWLKVNGEAIFGTTAGPLGPLGWGRCTSKADKEGGSLYLHVFDWPGDGKLLVPGLRSRVGAVSLLADGSDLQTAPVERGLLIRLPATAPDAIASVIKLDLDGPLEVSGVLPVPDGEGVLMLTPADAVCGGGIMIEEREGRLNLGHWTSFLDTASWEFEGLTPGMYRVEADVAGKESARLFAICGDSRLNASVEVSEGMNVYQKVDLGLIEIGEGEETLTLVPEKRKWKRINLRSLTLTPK